MLGGGGREERRARFAENKGVAQPAEKESILGGELLVRVENAQVSVLASGPSYSVQTDLSMDNLDLDLWPCREDNKLLLLV